MAVKIVTDSSCDLPTEVARRHDIRVVPLRVNFGADTYHDGVDLSPGEFQRLLLERPELPTTSQPPPRDFEAVCRPLLARGHHVVIITISSGLSGTYQSAVIAARTLGARVEVVDSLLASVGVGILAVKAARRAEAGESLEAVSAFVREERLRMQILCTLDSVENIVRGGRMNIFARKAAAMPDLKLILTRNPQGKVQILERVHGRRRALERLVALIGEGRPATWAKEIVGISHVHCLSEATYLAEEINSLYRPGEVIVREMGSTIGTHAGRGGIVVAR